MPLISEGSSLTLLLVCSLSRSSREEMELSFDRALIISRVDFFPDPRKEIKENNKNKI